MRRYSFLTGLVAILALGMGLGIARASEAEVAKCPIMGEPVNLAVSTPTDNGPVYFCCKGCIKKFLANPKEHKMAVHKQRKALAGKPKIQVTCPVSGKPVDQKVTAEYKGESVSFCCQDCVSKFLADPSKYRSALANSYTYQTKCPVMGETIDPKSFTTLPTGEKVYFCCKGCDKKLTADPAKYADNLAKQGYPISKKTIKMMSHDEQDGHDHDGHDHGGH